MSFEAPDVDKYDELFERVTFLFNGDEECAATWFRSPNPALGNIMPVVMFYTGREDRLEKFIAEAEEEQREGSSTH